MASQGGIELQAIRPTESAKKLGQPNKLQQRKDSEKQLLLAKRSKVNKKINRINKVCAVGHAIVAILCCIIFIVALVLYETEYTEPTLPSGQVALRNGDNVLLLEYNPRGIGNVTLAVDIDQSKVEIYNNTCDSFSNGTEYINQTSLLNISEGQQTYPLRNYYLVNGSSIQYSFDLIFTQEERNDTCMAEINIFNHYQKYDSFLRDPTSATPSEKHCLSSTQPNYTISAMSTDYYFVALHISPEYSAEIESIAYTATGFQSQYHLTGQPISCKLNALVKSCTIYPSNSQKSCVLAKSFSNSFINVSYSSGIDTHFEDLNETFLMLVITFGTFFFFYSPCIIISVVLVLCT